MTSHIFVYGTLLSGARHPMGARLARESQILGEATIQGRLYNLGRYPGLVESGDPADVVHGEVYALNSPATTLAWLDAYEGISSHAADNEYERCERAVRLASGAEVTAWVYLYRAPVTGRAAIAGGRWTSRRG